VLARKLSADKKTSGQKFNCTKKFLWRFEINCILAADFTETAGLIF